MDAPAVLIYTGPTLSGAALPSMPGARFLPPAAHGDVYRATLLEPPLRAILLIDGYFRARPAVRHKEILWALTRGIHVLGAASMGALRAAELAPFGMVGVGRIFEAFRDGTLEDDDEVAVTHGPAEFDYRPVSMAMVDIRATLAAAHREGVISVTSHDALVATGKAMFYPERTYTAILARGEELRLPSTELGALRCWLVSNRINLKREDALVALGRVRDFLESEVPPILTKFRFAQTTAWEDDVAAALTARP